MRRKLRIRHISNYEGRRTIMLVGNILGITELIENFQELANGKDEVNLYHAFYPDKDIVQNLKLKVTYEHVGLQEVLDRKFILQLTANRWDELMTKLKNYRNGASEEILLIHENKRDTFQVVLNAIKE